MATSGGIVVAAQVLVRLVSQAVRQLPGVARAGLVPQANLLGATLHQGVALRLTDQGAVVDCYLIARADTALQELGAAVQLTCAAVLRDIAGVAVHEVNVYIQDVEAAVG